MTFYQQILSTVERYLDKKKEASVFRMIFLLIFLSVSVQCMLGLSLKEWSSELGEKNEVTGVWVNNKVYIITKKNKTHSLMESHSLSNNTEDPNFVLLVEKADAQNDISIVFSLGTTNL